MLQISLDQPGKFSASDVPEPTLAPGDALVRVHRIGVCGTDLHAFAGNQPFFNYPRVLGHELGVEVLDPGTDPNGPEVEALVDYYRRAAGEHPDWHEYRSVMVADRRVLMMLAVEHVYGADIG